MSDLKSTLTVKVREDHFKRFNKPLFHGMQSRVIRAFISELGKEMESNGAKPLYAWLNGEKSLKLSPVDLKVLLDVEVE